MQQVRQSVFETNSSSSHSLTLSQDNLVDLPLSAKVLKSGKLTLQLKEYGWEWHRYYSPEEKANYLLTAIWGSKEAPLGSPEEAIEKLKAEDARIGMLCKVIEEHTGVAVVVEPGRSGYVDHQSEGTGLGLFESEERLKQFLFSHGAFVQTGNDNSVPTQTINTDRGPEEVYVRWYREPKEGYVEVSLKQASEWSTDLVLANGKVLKDEAPELLEQIQKLASVVRVRKSSRGKMNSFQHTSRKSRYSETMESLSRSGMCFSKNLVLNVRHKGNKTAEHYYMVDTDLVLNVPPELAQALQAFGPAQKAPRKRAKKKPVAGDAA